MNDQGRPTRAVRVVSWSWEPGAGEHRPRVPWLGVFFLLFGGLLLLQEAFPSANLAGSALVLALGLAFLFGWLRGGNVLGLYAGMILTALGLPSLLEAAGLISGPGWGTLFLGVGFLAIAGYRRSRQAGWGWQTVLGGILVLVGGTQVAAGSVPGFSDLGRLAWPLVLVAFGAYLMIRRAGPGRQSF